MSILKSGFPKELALFIRDKFGLNVFIETGTFRGFTTRWAAEYFKKVVTVELSKKLFNVAQYKCRKFKNIIFRYGDSSEELAKIVKELNEPALFWLDAHQCSWSDAGKARPSPILNEIVAIGGSPHSHFIIVDDAQFILAPAPDPHPVNEYPDFCTFLEEINRQKKHYIIVYEDIIVCVPESARAAVSDFCKNEVTRNSKMFGKIKLLAKYFIRLLVLNIERPFFILIKSAKKEDYSG